MPCQHHFKRLPNPPRDRVQCTLCGVHARAIHHFRTGRDGWIFKLDPPATQ